MKVQDEVTVHDRGCAREGRVSTPGCPVRLILHSNLRMKSHLLYAISKRTPVSPKAWKDIDDVQKELNRRLSWAHDRLSLVRDGVTSRPPFTFPLVQILNNHSRPSPSFGHAQSDDRYSPIPDACAAGSTRVRDNLWNAHLVAAFLRFVSARHPDLLLELRDDGGFVLPGAVWIRNGKVDLQRDWLARQRERALEMTGDLEAAMPFLWAEQAALEGHFFSEEASATDYSEVPEIKELNVDWNELAGMTLEEVANLVVDHAASRLFAPATV